MGNDSSLPISKSFLVYVDWTLESTPRPFYVGKGKRSRVCDKNRNPRHRAIAKAYGMRREVVFSSPDESVALKKERELIANLKTRGDVFGHWGANFTDGGDGTSGWKAPEAWRQAASERQAQRLASPEARQKRSAEAKAAWARLKSEGYTVSDEAKQKMRGSRKKLSRSTRNKMSQAQLLRWEEIRSGTRPAPKITEEVRDKCRGGKDKLRKPVLQLTLNGELLKEFSYITEASIETGVPTSHISECSRGLRKSAGGFIWKAKERAHNGEI